MNFLLRTRLSDHRCRVLVLIGITFLIKLLLASLLDLGNDEVYYWTYALHLDWSYFDHPPLVAWLIRLTTMNLNLHQELFVRLGALLASAVSTWLVFRIASVMKDEKAGWYAALLFTASIYSSVIAGLFILPDSPQAPFWFGAILLLAKMIKSTEASPKNWLLFGLAAGLCILCKVHGVFLWSGVVSYVVLFDRTWLKSPWMYIAIFISALVVSPIIIWNIQNDFVTYNFHSERVAFRDLSINSLSFFREIFGQIFYNNPINFFLVWLAVWHMNKPVFRPWKKYIRLFYCCFLPMIFCTTSLSLFRDTLPHWSGPAYSGLLILVALYLAHCRYPQYFLVIPGLLKYSLGLLVIVVIAGVTVINLYPGTLSSDKINIGGGDPTLDMYGWKQFGAQMDSLCRADYHAGEMPPEARIVISKWFPGAHIDFYVSSQTHLETYALGRPFDLHQYMFSNRLKKSLKRGDCAYFIQPSNSVQSDFPDLLKDSFEFISKKPRLVKQYRGGKMCREFAVFLLKGFKNDDSFISQNR